MRPNGRPTARAAVSSGNTDQGGVPAAVDVDRVAYWTSFAVYVFWMPTPDVRLLSTV